MALLSSGTTALATSGTGAVTALTVPPRTTLRLRLINEGAAAGFFSLDGATWARLPAGPGTSVSLDVSGGATGVTVSVKRDGSTDLSGVYAFAN